MSKAAHDKIMAGLDDALAYAKGDASQGVSHRVRVPQVDVRAARKKLGMTQKDFAQSFGVSVDTLRNWEQGRRHPRGPARVLLAVIDRSPKAVLDVVENEV